jgi:ATP-dependent Lhr-like helicase
MDYYNQLSPFIKDFIYRENWTDLRDIQNAACEVIFGTECHLLLSSETASGKTEAAFLPTITMLHNKPSESVGILYISPLKALINDQFERLEKLLREAKIPVTKWHGDANSSAKARLVQNPKGILQITPESLESLYIKKQDVLKQLFSDLRFIIIDEVHHFVQNERGGQLICLIELIERLCKISARRIGLSATVGSYDTVEDWLNMGSDRGVVSPIVPRIPKRLRLSLEVFDKSEREKQIDYLYKQTYGKKALIFANSRNQTEETAVALAERAKFQGGNNVYRVHHGSVSAGVRQNIEEEMKHSDESVVTCATLTLEMGIDIGSLDKIMHLGCPISVSSFAQRIGRTGRKAGQVAEMQFAIEGSGYYDGDFKYVNWDFIKTIATIELFLEGYNEPIRLPKKPFSLLYHRTMAFLYSLGEVSPPFLARNILTLGMFKDISQKEYQEFLKYLLEINHLQKTEMGNLQIGIDAENIVNHYGFCAVFDSPEEWNVMNGEVRIGGISKQLQVGTSFTLAGGSWTVKTVAKTGKTIQVVPCEKARTNAFTSSGKIFVDGRVLEKMREVLLSEKEYRYLSDSALDELMRLRTKCKTAAKTGIVKHDDNFYIFPWLGTREYWTLLLSLEYKNPIAKATAINYVFMELEADYVRDEKKVKLLLDEVKKNPPFKEDLFIPKHAEVEGKFNRFVAPELLDVQFREDFL